MGLESIFLVVSGLGLLLFGMKMMSTGLELVAGDSLQTILKRATSNRLLGVIAGVIATICINSSTAVTIITVGFVNSKLINLTQAIGIIMGANVGTTFSAQLIAFKFDTVAPLIIFIGAMMFLRFKSKTIKNIGYVILGFGILLFSINVMGAPLKAFAQQPSFNSMLAAVQNPLAAIFAGFIFTAIIQSSSATMGLLVTMHLSGVPIPFETSAFIILGTNIGTSTTTVIASIPASRESKRAAIFHITYDIIGTSVFGTLCYLFPGILSWFQATWAESARQVAMFHTLYNVATLCLLFPFVKWLVMGLEKVIPLKENETANVYQKELIYLNNKNNIRVPSLAVSNAHLEICRMGEIANNNLSLALDAFLSKNEEEANMVLDNEKVIDYLNHNIASKLVDINNMTLSESDAKRIGEAFRILTDMERIGDHAENIAESALSMIGSNISFSDIAIDELKKIGDLTARITALSLETYKNHDTAELPEIEAMEEEIDKLAKKYSQNHITRLRQECCEPRGGVVFTDTISDLERSANHSYNIAFSILYEGKRNKKASYSPLAMRLS